MSEVPAGIVTFLFTDIEGSTRLWAADATAMARSLERHDRIIREAMVDRGGFVFGWAGDHFRAAFVDADDAVAAAIAAQTALGDEHWDDGPALRVRMSLHRGRATQRDGDYFGPVPNTAARLEAIGSGGQVLMSQAVADVVDIERVNLGRHRLRDVPDPIEISQVGVASFPPLRLIDPSLSTLPLPGSRIIGRSEAVARARELLGTDPIVTLTGIGGCGKTRLAIEVAYQELPSRADGCYFADLSSVSGASELPAALAAAVRLELVGPTDGALGQVVAHLARRDALLVLDNCEHILDACAEFAECLLSQGATTALLATSRERLDVPGEQVIVVGPLGVDGEAHAVELFVERAAAVNPTFDRDGDTNRATVAEICRTLDGVPLAIELAAARSSVLSPSEILDRMADRFRLLSGGRGRHQQPTLQATLDWSYELLDDDEQRFFRRCGVFTGSFDLPAAVAVSGLDDYDAMDLLGSLVAKSLLAVVETGDSTARYRLLETVRLYSRDLLVRSEELDVARDDHLRWFRSRAATADFAQAADLVRAGSLRLDWPNIASALEWALAREGTGAAAQAAYQDAAVIAFGCQGLWESRVPAIEGRRWVEQIADALEPGGHRDWMRYIGAVLAMQLDDFAVVHSRLDALLDAKGTAPAVRAQAAGLMAFLCCRRSPDRTRDLVPLAFAVVEHHGLSDEYLGPGHWALGCLALYEDRADESLASFARSYELLVSTGRHTNHVVMAGLALASAHVLAGDPARALEIVDSREWSSSVWDSSPIVRAIALVDLERQAEAADLVVGFGVAALRGRLSRMANDALVGFAALALSRDEQDHAWLLLQQAASPKTPFTIGLAEGLAGRAGHGRELREIHRRRRQPLSELDATAHLRTELDRIRRTAT